MTDIHSHILPCLDDGARSIEQSIAMFRIAAMEGIHTIIATPHCYGHKKDASFEEVSATVDKMRAELEKEGILIDLYAGNEIYYRQGVEEEIENGKIHTLAGSSYVLVEFHPQEDYAYIFRALNRLSSYGYCPILAHAERYENLYCKKGRVEELKKCGVKIHNADLYSEQTGYGYGYLFRCAAGKPADKRLCGADTKPVCAGTGDQGIAADRHGL